MAGLFEKDLRLLIRNKQFVIVIVFMAFMFSLSGNLSMILPYMTVFGTIFSVSTISYDEADNGYMYLMTLPITYKDYVWEKYLFCTIGGIVTGALTIIFFIVGTAVKGEAINAGDILIAVLIVLPLIINMESFMIPAQLKFGNSKSRNFIVLTVGIIVGSAYVIDRFVTDIGQLLAEAGHLLENVSLSVWIISVSAITVIILVVSFLCSVRIMGKKQY